MFPSVAARAATALRIATNLLDVPAEVIGFIYQRRWTIESVHADYRSSESLYRGGVLGLNGTMSEAELHILHSRMYQGLLNKAKRGEVFNHAPIGYAKQLCDEFALDPDHQVQSVVHLIFDEFERQGTLHGLLRYLVHHGIRLPIRPQSGPNRGQLEWRGPNRVDAAKPLASSAVRGLLLLGPSRYRPASKSCRSTGDRPHKSSTARLSGLVAGSLPGLTSRPSASGLIKNVWRPPSQSDRAACSQKTTRTLSPCPTPTTRT